MPGARQVDFVHSLPSRMSALMTITPCLSTSSPFTWSSCRDHGKQLGNFNIHTSLLMFFFYFLKPATDDRTRSPSNRQHGPWVVLNAVPTKHHPETHQPKPLKHGKFNKFFSYDITTLSNPSPDPPDS